MEIKQMGEYIGSLLQNSSPEIEIREEIPNVINLLSVYEAGLRGQDFPIDNLVEEEMALKKIPEQFHTLVAKGAILKSKKGNMNIRDYLYKDAEQLLKRFKYYFINNPLT
jgi:hypothetical protein